MKNNNKFPFWFANEKSFVVLAVSHIENVSKFTSYFSLRDVGFNSGCWMISRPLAGEYIVEYYAIIFLDAVFSSLSLSLCSPLRWRSLPLHCHAWTRLINLCPINSVEFTLLHHLVLVLSSSIVNIFLCAIFTHRRRPPLFIITATRRLRPIIYPRKLIRRCNCASPLTAMKQQ